MSQEFKTIQEYLTAFKIENEFKYPEFHVFKLEDYQYELPKKLGPYKCSFFEIVFSKNDIAEVVIGNTIFKTENKNNITFSSPNQPISFEIEDSSKATGYVLIFTLDFLNFSDSLYEVFKKLSFFNIHSSPFCFLDKEQSAILTYLLEKTYREFQLFNEDNIEIMRSYLTIFLFEIKRILDGKQLKSIIQNRSEEIAYRFENVIKATIKKKQPISFYANKIHVSPIYLAECVKKATGKTAKYIIDEYIILEAKSLLHSSENTIENIAEGLGFNDSSNFVKYFKKHTNLTPRAFKLKP